MKWSKIELNVCTTKAENIYRCLFLSYTVLFSLKTIFISKKLQNSISEEQRENQIPEKRKLGDSMRLGKKSVLDDEPFFGRHSRLFEQMRLGKRTDPFKEKKKGSGRMMSLVSLLLSNEIFFDSIRSALIQVLFTPNPPTHQIPFCCVPTSNIVHHFDKLQNSILFCV